MSQPEINKRLVKINRIFAENGWFNTQSSQVRINHALDKCIEIASILTDGEFDLFCELLRKYLLFEFEKYIPAFGRVLDKIVPCHDLGHFYKIVPMVAPKDKGKVKSGNSLLYDFTNTVWARSRKFNNLQIKTFMNIDDIDEPGHDNKNSTLLVIDDFVGTGDTAVDFIEGYCKLLLGHKAVVFVALVAMEAGVKAINGKGYDIVYDELAPRGIADCAIMKGASKFYKLMESIEDQIDMEPLFKNGYKLSEALVTLQRTPNNTFPVFWASKLKSGQPCPSLFPRNVNV